MNRHVPATAVAALCLAALLAPAAAQQLPSPKLTAVFPPGARQGAAVEVELSGGELAEPQALHFSHPGLSAQLLPAEKGKPVRFKVAVAAGVPVGDHDVRFVGSLGISNPRAFCVGDLAESQEAEPNNERAQATRLAMDSVVNGRVSPSEDVDWFVFAARKGQRVLVECRAWRIDSRLDGFMWLHNAGGRELASSQDESIRDERRDPFIDFVAPEDGDYLIKLTDFMFGGSGDHFYRLGVSTAPLIDFHLPTAVKPGSKAALTLFGRNLPEGRDAGLSIKGRPLSMQSLSLDLPADAAAAAGLRLSEVLRPPASPLDGVELRVRNSAGHSNARLLLLSDLDEQPEAEPNDTPDKAQPLTLPCAVSGSFLPGDSDCFAVVLRKGESVHATVFAERIGSPADPELELLKPDGAVAQQAGDDGENIGQIRFPSNTRDLRLSFAAPADGRYVLRLEHLFRQVQGGPQYLYRLEARAQLRPDFRLVAVPTHDIQMDATNLRRGGRGRMDVLVWRRDGFDEPIRIDAGRLPKGVTAEPIIAGKGVRQVALVFDVAADAELAHGEIDVTGTGQVGGQEATRRARGGVIVWDTGNTAAISRMTRGVVLAVRDKCPFTVTASPARATVRQGDAVTLDLAATRAEGVAAIQVSAAGMTLPGGMEVPIARLEGAAAQITVKTDKMKPGEYGIVLAAEAQVPWKNADGSARNIRVVLPTNVIHLVIEAKPEVKK